MINYDETKYWKKKKCKNLIVYGPPQIKQNSKTVNLKTETNNINDIYGNLLNQTTI